MWWLVVAMPVLVVPVLEIEVFEVVPPPVCSASTIDGATRFQIENGPLTSAWI